ncbi:MAG: hypothetical protein PHT51_00455 [Patescibacteria group bacterium]|nr:hypothetical protein [Patescibacteria group bacterium]MDD4611036.1 hypothetical protein [Patescibacteria group bacterium]
MENELTEYEKIFHDGADFFEQIKMLFSNPKNFISKMQQRSNFTINNLLAFSLLIDRDTERVKNVKEAAMLLFKKIIMENFLISNNADADKEEEVRDRFISFLKEIEPEEQQKESLDELLKFVTPLSPLSRKHKMDLLSILSLWQSNYQPKDCKPAEWWLEIGKWLFHYKAWSDGRKIIWLGIRQNSFEKALDYLPEFANDERAASEICIDIVSDCRHGCYNDRPSVDLEIMLKEIGWLDPDDANYENLADTLQEIKEYPQLVINCLNRAAEKTSGDEKDCLLRYLNNEKKYLENLALLKRQLVKIEAKLPSDIKTIFNETAFWVSKKRLVIWPDELNIEPF